MNDSITIEAEVPNRMNAGDTYEIEVLLHVKDISVAQVIDNHEHVYLSYHWYNEDRSAYEWDNNREHIFSLGVEDKYVATLKVTSPSLHGNYFLQIDIVEEGVRWFSDDGMLSSDLVNVVIETETKMKTKSDRIKVDVYDILEQLSSPSGNHYLQQFLFWNHRWVASLVRQNNEAANDRITFIKKEMPLAVYTLNQYDVIRSKAAEIRHLDGHILDLGVWKGESTRSLSKIFPEQTIHGFDSFEGLPGDWAHVLSGEFDINGRMPIMPTNVRLYKGLFEDTLPQWLYKNDSKPISLLRVDCDLYSSTKTIFDVLSPLLVEGTWICFDELIGYHGYEHHEYKALIEFLRSSDHTFEYVAYGLTYTIGYLKKK